MQEERDKARVEHNISSLQKDMVRLNTLISKKRGEQDRLVHGAILAEKDFVNALKVSLRIGLKSIIAIYLSPLLKLTCM